MKFDKYTRRNMKFSREARLAARKLKKYRNANVRHKMQWKQVLAKAMRDFPTPAEQLCKATLLHMGFRHQAIVLGYIPDFTHFGYRIIVEIDGSIHETKKAEDAYRDEVLKSHCWKVLRFSNEQVSKHPELIYNSVKAAIDAYRR